MPAALPAAKTIKLRHNKKSSEYYKLYAGFDIETTNVDIKDEHLAFMYHWQFSLCGDFYGCVFTGRTWEAFEMFIAKLKRYYDLSADKRLIVWIANAGFEFQFFRKLFDWDPEDFFSREERHPLKFRNGGIEYHEALTISGGSLEQLAKDYTTTKKLKGDLDYSILRNSTTKLTALELDYCINDVTILSEWSAYIFETYIKPDKRIPLTKTGILRSLCRQNGEKMLTPQGWRAYRDRIYEAYPDEKTYALWFRYLFRGGYVHSNILMTAFTIEGVDGYDETSAYPYHMDAFDEYPMTPFKEETFSEDLLENKCCIIKVTFYDIKRRWAHSIESKSKAVELEDSKRTKVIIDNGRIAQAGKLTVWLTNIDFQIYKRFYKWRCYKVEECTTSEKGFLPLFLRKTLNKLYIEKDRLKRAGLTDTPEYKLIKQKINSFFGMCVTRIELSKITYDNMLDIWDVKEKDLNFEEEIKSQFLLPQWGIFITALSRRSLLNVTADITEAIGDGRGENGAGVIYNDTDSIKVYDPEGKAKEIIERYNATVYQRMLKLGYTPEAFKTLGQFEHEAHYDRFKTLGAKRYLTDELGIIKATVAGLPKASILRVEGDPFEEFTLDGMTLESDVSLKKTIAYNDTPTHALVDGEEMFEESSAGIYDISFTLNLDKAYYTLIAQGLTERIKKYGDKED